MDTDDFQYLVFVYLKFVSLAGAELVLLVANKQQSTSISQEKVWPFHVEGVYLSVSTTFV